MGKRGTKPQPSNVRRLTGDTRPSRTPEEPMALPDSEPEYAPWWDDKDAPTETAREVWHRVDRYLRSLKMRTEVDTDQVRTYVLAVVLMDRLGKVVAHAPAVVRDANGQPKANPILNEWRKAAQQVRNTGAIFGLAGPNSRLGRENVIGSEARRSDLLA